jgi:hypothetical protein
MEISIVSLYEERLQHPQLGSFISSNMYLFVH